MERRPYLRLAFAQERIIRQNDIRAAALAWDQRALVVARSLAASHPVDWAGIVREGAAVGFTELDADTAGIVVDSILRQRDGYPHLAATADAADPGTPAVVEVGVAAMVDDREEALGQAVATYRASHPGLPADWDLAPRRETENPRNLDTIWLTVPYSALLL